MFVIAAGNELSIAGDGKQGIHDGGAFLQILDGLKQRDDVDVQPGRAAWAQQAGFLEQQGEFEQIGDAVGLRDDAVG